MKVKEVQNVSRKESKKRKFPCLLKCTHLDPWEHGSVVMALNEEQGVVLVPGCESMSRKGDYLTQDAFEDDEQWQHYEGEIRLFN